MLEAAIKTVLRERATAATDAHPDAETLAAYLERALEGEARAVVEGHLAHCEACLDQVLLCSAPAAPAPAGIVSRGDAPGVVVRLLRGAAELVCRTMEIHLLPAPEALALRSGTGARAALKCVRFGRSFGELAVAVEVEATAAGLGEIRVAARVGETWAEDVRVTLCADRRELASYLVRSGSVAFQDVADGNYVIRLSRRGGAIGEVSLRLERD